MKPCISGKVILPVSFALLSSEQCLCVEQGVAAETVSQRVGAESRGLCVAAEAVPKAAPALAGLGACVHEAVQGSQRFEADSGGRSGRLECLDCRNPCIPAHQAGDAAPAVHDHTLGRSASLQQALIAKI